MLIAVSTATQLGGAVSSLEVLPCLFYPYLLAASSLIYIVVLGRRGKK